MALQTINLGVAPGGAGGDAARTAFDKINKNFSDPTHAASKLAQTSATDTTAGALMAAGAFGLGSSNNVLLPGGNLNATDIASGEYRVVGSHTGTKPPGMTDGVVKVLRYNTTDSVQAFYWVVGARTFYRASLNGIWGAWVEAFSTGNILGTVSQSGGVPTGAIIERGKNANGEYTKYADGTLECWGSMILPDLPINGAHFGGFRAASQIWSYPAAFAAPPSAIANCDSVTAFSVDVVVPSLFSCNFCFTAIAAQPAAERRVSLFAKGRWFL
ncbi:pyocin knob domain-containing protein [Stutzerimonas stutzeri]|uniref:pyocin knob domain-containing protein n=1 Tax=Stutzerimonas stutzeri TaxID=316 RepID=UPI00210B3DD2|nr:pyocin knob domain-containing protein [Stutzerimonas stutzeri]MCQ4257480.1 pyocin knob domain-containing protein [Stutzerimonas stutzeri]